MKSDTARQQHDREPAIRCLPVAYLPGGEHFVDLRLHEFRRCMDMQTVPFDSRTGEEWRLLCGVRICAHCTTAVIIPSTAERDTLACIRCGELMEGEQER